LEEQDLMLKVMDEQILSAEQKEQQQVQNEPIV
jgi:hypothetical protein